MLDFVRRWGVLGWTIASACFDTPGNEGRVLLGELNCVACHAASAEQAPWITPKIAPQLNELGNRASPEWLQRYLLNPHDSMPGTTMPDVLGTLPTNERAASAEALTHFLLSNSKQSFARLQPDPKAVARGELLYHRVGCVACHDPQNEDAKLNRSIPLPRMEEKWAFEGLRRFLLDPLAARPSGRMPRVPMNEGEAADLAHYLLRETEVMAVAKPFIADPLKAGKGRALYATLNCATCHEGKLPARAMSSLADLDISKGCLAEIPGAQAPNFHFTDWQRTQLRTAITALKAKELSAPSPAEKLADRLASLNCLACHTRDGRGGVTAERDPFFTSNGEDLGDEGRIPPRLDGVGDRLRAQWLTNVLARAASVRPYFNTHMPQFGATNGHELAALFVAIDRHPQTIKGSDDPPAAQQEAGRHLVGTDGLSCIVCHRFNRQMAHTLQVVDLATTTERLNEDYFRAFLRDPNRFHPGTRMPSFWPEGVSPFPAVLNGDTDRQHAAIWTYLADGTRAKFPAGLSRQNVELIAGEEALVYRGKLWEAGFRAVAVGYPGQLNMAFDAEEMRLALLWRGRFLNAGPHWGVQGMGRIRPLGSNVVVFPHGAPLAILRDANSPWPTEPGKALGLKFRGYQLDAQKRPTLLYSLREIGVEDFIAPIEGNPHAGIRRTMRFANAPPEGLHLRVATGKISATPEGAWRLDNTQTVRVSGNTKAFVRATGDQQELLAPIQARDGKSALEVDYVW